MFKRLSLYLFPCYIFSIPAFTHHPNELIIRMLVEETGYETRQTLKDDLFAASTKPGPDHGPDRGPDRRPDRGPDRGPDHGPDHGSDHRRKKEIKKINRL